MKRVVVFLLLMMGLWCWSNSIPQVENFNVNQRLDGSQLIDIFYDVSDAEGDTLTVTMQASNDDGITWILNCAMISGDFGENIMPGTGKQIVWDFGEEHPGNFSENYKVRLQIDDHYVEQNNDWCLVLAGEFTWGPDDEIQTIDYDYEIMKYEVTNIQYLSYLEETFAAGDVWIVDNHVYGHYDGDVINAAGDYILYDLGTPYPLYDYGQISYGSSSFIINVPSGYSAGDFDDHPVVLVSWFGANAYAEHYGWRFPTEQEWEKAARGMTGYEYPWGDVISSDRANYDVSGDPWEEGTTPVGYYNGENGTIDSPSPYGCYDMCGNVWDWNNTWLQTSYRGFRGGTYLSAFDSEGLRSWFPGLGDPINTSTNIGFRCARTVE